MHPSAGRGILGGMSARPFALVAFALLAYPAGAVAGMPRVTAVLTEPARQRVEVISFFLVVLAAAGLVVRWQWNALARDFPRLPRLTYRGAAGLVVVWGAAFVLVLTMISGARELMTPGAWKPSGATYVLTDAPAGPDLTDRRSRLDTLKAALWEYARANGGRLPEADRSAAIPADRWATPHPSGVRYVYLPGQTPDLFAGGALVAVEPDVFDGTRLGLFADGSVRPVTADELAAAFSPPAKGTP